MAKGSGDTPVSLERATRERGEGSAAKGSGSEDFAILRAEPAQPVTVSLAFSERDRRPIRKDTGEYQ